MTPNRLEYLRSMLTKYAHCWKEFPSNRMQRWQAEYDSARTDSPEVWEAYCERFNHSLHHDAGDILA